MLRLVSTAGDPPVLEVADGPGLALPGLTLRPLARGETAPLMRVFRGLSARSRYLRFLTGIPELRPDLLTRLADVDHDRHGCWVVSFAGEPVAIGRYIRSREDPHTADVALEVVDACQGVGLGRLTVQVLAAAAADAGVTTLSFLADETNTAVRRLTAAFPGARLTVEYGVLSGSAPIPDLPRVDAAQVAHVARWAREAAVLRAEEAA